MKEFIITFVVAMFITSFFNGISFAPASQERPELSQNDIQLQSTPADAPGPGNSAALLKHATDGS
jgi:hypothetical protein